MKIGIDSLKRLIVCPVLHKNNWDYRSISIEDKFTNYIIEEMLRWYARKGRRISYDMICPIILNKGLRDSIDTEEITNLQISLKSFTKNGLYSRINIPMISPEIAIHGRDANILEYKPSAISMINDNAIIVLHNENIKNINDLVQSYEAMMGAVWSFYCINKYPIIYNLHRDKVVLNEIKFKPDQSYIRESKKYLLNITEELKYKKYYTAPNEVCSNCSRREECLAKIKVTQKNCKK